MTLKAMIRFPTTLLALASVPAVLLGGTIEGKVLLKGPPPALSTLEVSTVPLSSKRRSRREAPSTSMTRRMSM